MTKPRPGYRNVTFQMPDVIYEIIEQEAEQQRRSLTATLIDGLCRGFKIPLSMLPPRRKPGREARTKPRGAKLDSKRKQPNR